MGEMYLKPYKPIAKRRTDIFTYIVRFVCGCLLGVLIGGYIAVRTNQNSAQAFALEGDASFPFLFYITVLGVTLFTGFIAAILGDSFWGMFRRKYP